MLKLSLIHISCNAATGEMVLAAFNSSPFTSVTASVSYTHLDVYKRQIQTLLRYLRYMFYVT